MLLSGKPETRAAQAALAAAFGSFKTAANSLEKSYRGLQEEVTGLRRQLEEVRRELSQEREAARHWQLLARVTRLLAHEIRNPLASMELFANLLVHSRELSSECRQWALNLQSGTRLISATMDNILHLRNAAVLKTAAVEIGLVVRQTAELLQPMAAQSSVNVMVQERARGVRVQGDPFRLQQALLNLGINAIRAMTNGGRLALVISAARGLVKINITDTGPGVPVQVRNRIFDAGFTTRAGGLGLGLAVAQKIAEQHGGTLRLLDTEAGATFCLSLPRVRKATCGC